MQEIEILSLITIGILSMTFLALAFIAFFNFSKRKIILEKIKAKDLEIKYQEDLLHNNILTQERERQRIAKDLHDDIGSKLNVIHLNLFQINKHGDGTESFQQSMELAKQLIHKTINSTRRISHDLLPPTLEKFGLASALEELCDGYKNSEDITVDFTAEADKERLQDQRVNLSFFRVAQELINNSIRHGKATHISVTLNVMADNINLNYQDNGIGMDIKQITEQKGMGMKNIDSRLRMIGATIDYQSAPGKGFKVSIKQVVKFVLPIN